MTNPKQDIAAIIEANYETIFAFSVRALGCRHEAEDLAQDVCLTLAERLPEYRGEAKVTSWLYRIVANAARDRMRNSARRCRAGVEWGERETLRRAEDVERSAGRAFLQEAMNQLDPSQRVTISLLVTGGFSQAEVAEILEVAPGTVAWRVSEIKKRLASLTAVSGETE